METWQAPDLRDTAAVVTGASRGAGRAIAAAPGEGGATVYVTGRSVRGAGTTEGLPGTIEDAAEEVAARGGLGIPARCDHTVDADVEALFARVREEQGTPRPAREQRLGRLRPHGVASVALAPGFMRTERVLAVHAQKPFDLGPTESPAYAARAVASLAADPHVLDKTGRILTAGELAREYGFNDVDGRQPEPFRLPSSDSEG